LKMLRRGTLALSRYAVVDDSRDIRGAWSAMQPVCADDTGVAVCVWSSPNYGQDGVGQSCKARAGVLGASRLWS